MKQCVRRYKFALWVGLLIYMVFAGGDAYAEIFKGKTFQIDIPDSYKMTVYNEKSEMAFFAVHPEGASISVIVQKNPFVGKEADPTGEKRLEIATLTVQTLKGRLWDYYSGQMLVGMSKGEMKINGDRTFFHYRWTYFAREPKEEHMELSTYQYIDKEHLYTITLAAWRPDFAKYEEELENAAKTITFVETPPGEMTKPTKKEEKDE